jgi:hypothetical protein
VVKVRVVRRRERSLAAPIEANAELDRGIGAAAKVEGLTLAEVVLRLALLELLLALRRAAGELAAVGGVGAGVVLDIAGAAERGLLARECVAVDGEGAVAG